MCGVPACEGERTAREMRILLDNTRCSIQRDRLLAILTTLVNFNTHSNCILGILRMYTQTEMLQRNSILNSLSIRYSITSSPYLYPMTTWARPVGQYDIPLVRNREGLTSFRNVQSLTDRLCSQLKNLLSSQSLLQPFQTMPAISEYFSSHNQYIRIFLSRLLHTHVENTQSHITSTKLSISITIVPNGFPMGHHQSSGLLNNRVTFRHQDSITSLLHLPPLSTTNNVPLIVSWTLTTQQSSLLQVVSYIIHIQCF